MARIVHAEARDDYTLEIELDNRHKIIYDMKPRLQAVRFYELNDLEVFKNVYVEHSNTIIWNSLCQITIDEIISVIER